MASRKGIPNKYGAEVKAEIIAAFHALGGRDEFVDWGKKNRGLFYRLWARLAPTEVMATIDLRDVREVTEGELIDIATGGSAGSLGAPERSQELGGVHLLSGSGNQASETSPALDQSSGGN